MKNPQIYLFSLLWTIFLFFDACTSVLFEDQLECYSYRFPNANEWPKNSTPLSVFTIDNLKNFNSTIAYENRHFYEAILTQDDKSIQTTLRRYRKDDNNETILNISEPSPSLMIDLDTKQLEYVQPILLKEMINNKTGISILHYDRIYSNDVGKIKLNQIYIFSLNIKISCSENSAQIVNATVIWAQGSSNNNIPNVYLLTSHSYEYSTFKNLLLLQQEAKLSISEHYGKQICNFITSEF